VAAQSTVSNNVVQYDVAVSLPTADASVRLGQTGNVTITTGSHVDVLYVPTSAITTSGSVSTVTRRVDGVDSIVQVQTGLVGSTGTEIVRGLSQGDAVVLPTGDSTGSFTFPGSGSSPPAQNGSGSSSPSSSTSSR
jgi:multidrug efflux pump subunit AcrA (membrane-fusion protein)